MALLHAILLVASILSLRVDAVRPGRVWARAQQRSHNTLHTSSTTASTTNAPQLVLAPCSLPATRSWFQPLSSPVNRPESSHSSSPGPVFHEPSKRCVEYDTATTNLVLNTCIFNSSTQYFSWNASSGVVSGVGTRNYHCWDVQYYGNTTGSTLGMYTCQQPTAGWEVFRFDPTTQQIVNTPTGLCVVPETDLEVPKPTKEQLAWTRGEIGVMISYDMITQLTNVSNPQHFCINAGGDHGFAVPPPKLFNPSNLSTDSWIEAALAVNASYTLLVASHCSGFLLWPSNVTIPRYGRYNYTVATSPLAGRDIVDEYVTSAKKHGLPFSFYLTWNYNYIFNAGCCDKIMPGPLAPGQINVTLDEYHDIMRATIEEIWSRYPNEIYELWFDGGESDAQLNQMISKYQPQAVQVDGTQPPNLAHLVGHESGFAPYPVWSTAQPEASDSGSPTAANFIPAEADTTVSNHDAWFWKPSMTYRSLDELKAVYVNTVGANSVLELGIFPDATGSIPADQMSVLQQFGDWIRRCYSPSAAAASQSSVSSNVVTIKLPGDGAVIDRVVLREDQTQGELVLAYQVEVQPPGGYRQAFIPAGSGQAVGNKRIMFLATGPIPASQVRVTATQVRGGNDTVANWLSVAAYSPCQ